MALEERSESGVLAEVQYINAAAGPRDERKKEV